MVVDAGGGTVDISTYNQRELSDGLVSYQEVSLPQCTQRFSGQNFILTQVIQVTSVAQFLSAKGFGYI